MSTHAISWQLQSEQSCANKPIFPFGSGRLDLNKFCCEGHLNSLDAAVLLAWLSHLNSTHILGTQESAQIKGHGDIVYNTDRKFEFFCGDNQVLDTEAILGQKQMQSQYIFFAEGLAGKRAATNSLTHVGS